MPQALKLTYLPMRARAEAVRIYLAFCKLAYEDVVVDFDVFSYAKGSGDFPFDQVCAPAPRARALQSTHIRRAEHARRLGTACLRCQLRGCYGAGSIAHALHAVP